MKTTLLSRLGLLLATGFALNAQAQNPQLLRWAIPPNQVSFTGASPVQSLLPNSIAPYGYNLSASGEVSTSSNSMHDSNGNLLFFVTQDGDDYDRLKVFDKNGDVITDANSNTELKFDYTWTDVSGMQHNEPGHIFSNWSKEVSIIPVPGNCNQYYIVLGFQDEHDFSSSINYQPVYAIIDLSLSTNGKLISSSGTANLFNLTNLPGMPTGAFQPFGPNLKYNFGIATTPYRPEAANQDRFIYIFSSFSGLNPYGFYKYKLDATSISFVSVEYFTLSAPALFSNDYYSEMEIARLPSGNYRIAKAIENRNIYYCDLDYTNGSIISGTEKIVSLSVGKALEGLEFSPDGNTLYYSYHGTANNAEYITGLSSAGTPLQTALAPLTGTTVGFIEMGHDQNIYFSTAPGQYLAAKPSPNSPATGTWSMTAVTLQPDYASNFSTILPDQIDGEVLYHAAPTITGNNYACSASPEIYTLSGAYDPSVYYTWTITGGTPSTYTGNGNTLAITWTSAGGTISVRSGCSALTTFTVNPCCRYTGTVPPGVSVVYFNDKTESGGVVNYTGVFNIIVINGIYTVNGIVNYTNCKTYFAPDAKVNINSGATLKLSRGTVWQAGCDAMWNGIVINGGGNLQVENSTIRDAKLAVESKAGAPYSITNGSKLNANYRNILVDIYGPLTHPGIINNSTISCLNTSGLPANCLIAPYLGKRTYSGIESNDVTQLNVGLDVAGQTNTFNNMDKGIINTRTGLQVYNNNFLNLTYSTSGTGRGIISTNSAAPAAEKTLVVGGGNPYQSNTFNNCAFGLFVNYNQDVTVTKNTFTNLGEAADIFYCSGTDNEISFNNNIINDCSWGLHAASNDGGKKIDVLENVINSTIVTPKPNCTAISSENTILGFPHLTINSNTITSVSTGIKASFFLAATIRNNHIYSMSNLGGGVAVNGILAIHCATLDAESNIVTGAGSSYTDQVGMRMETCDGAQIVYNSVENIGRGLFFGGIAHYIITAKNHMLNNTDAFVLNYGQTDPQRITGSGCAATENSWEGTFTTHLLSYYSVGTASQHYLYGPLLPTTNPGGSTNPTGLISSVYPSTGYSAIPTAGCLTASGYRVSKDSKIEKLISIAKDETNYPIYNESSKWMDKYTLYTRIKAEPELSESADLSSFANEISSTGIAKIAKINELISAGNIDLSQLESLVNSISEDNIIESNLKVIFTAIILIRKQESISGQLDKLRKIATQCPYEGGPGVYSARVLLETEGETIHLNDCEIVPAQQRTVSSISSITAGTDNTISVMPNPNNGLFVVSCSTEEAKDIYIYDAMGKVVFEKHATSDKTINIDITTHAKGIYFVKVISNEGTILKKIVNQ